MSKFTMVALRDSVKPNEQIVADIKISKAAILVEWLAIPAVFLVFFLTVTLPAMIKTLATSAAKAVFMEAIGVKEVGFADVLAHPWRAMMPSVPEAIVVFVQVLVWLLFLSWLIVTIVRTMRHFGYEILLTDVRVLARARGENFECEWKEMKNVFVEQSLWGKLFHYGSVTLQGPRGAVTVRHVAEPETVKAKFKAYTDNF